MRHDTARGDPTSRRRPVGAGPAGHSAARAARGRSRDRCRRIAVHGSAGGDHGVRPSVPPRCRLGRPEPTSVVLWTRVTPRAARRRAPAGAPRLSSGSWRGRVFLRVVRRGRFGTGPGRDHTVKLTPGGLRPALVLLPVPQTATSPSAAPVPRPATAAAGTDCASASCRAPTSRRLLRRLPPPRRPRRPPRRHAPRRLPLRGRRRRRRRPHRTSAGARDREPVRLPPAARAVQGRPGPAAAARALPLHRHLGRPRGHQRQLAGGGGEPPARRG